MNHWGGMTTGGTAGLKTGFSIGFSITLNVHLSCAFLSNYDFRCCTLKLRFLENKPFFGKDFALLRFLCSLKLRFFWEIIRNLTVHWVNHLSVNHWNPIVQWRESETPPEQLLAFCCWLLLLVFQFSPFLNPFHLMNFDSFYPAQGHLMIVDCDS